MDLDKHPPPLPVLDPRPQQQIHRRLRRRVRPPPTSRTSRRRVRAPLQRSPSAPQPAAGCSPTATPPPCTDRDLQDPTTRPRRRPPPRISARRRQVHGFRAPTGWDGRVSGRWHVGPGAIPQADGPVSVSQHD
jgi:hypothetical protein